MNRSITTLLRLVVVSSVVSFPGVSQAACEQLVQLTIPNTVIKSASTVNAGTFDAPNGRTYTIPALCRVEGVSRPTSDSNINFEVWLPLDSWNGRYHQLSNGGFSGAIDYNGLAARASVGDAVASTDDGHQDVNGLSVAWAYQHPQRIVDYAYRALEETAVSGKIVARSFYKAPIKYSYLSGCSAGGGRVLRAAERFSSEWDGYIAGAPALDLIRQQLQFAWYEKGLQDHAGPGLTVEKLRILQGAALKACKPKAHLVGEIAADSRYCKFDLASVRCRENDGKNCLAAPEISVVQSIYDGLRNPKNGEQIILGLAPTMEAGSAWRRSFSDTRTGAIESMVSDFFGSLVYDNPSWKLSDLDLAKDLEAAENKVIDNQTLAQIFHATSSNLAGVRNRGSKILVYSGWGDAVVSQQGLIDYYTTILDRMGPEETMEFYRLFMVPGMGHCQEGSGPHAFGQYSPMPPTTGQQHDIVASLEAWVEQGIAPESLIATKYKDDKPSNSVVVTRKLCPFPKISKYDGRGNINAEASYSCSLP